MSVTIHLLFHYVFVVWPRMTSHFFLRKRVISIYLRVLISDSCSSEFEAKGSIDVPSLGNPDTLYA